jgi:hypothetical protein
MRVLCAVLEQTPIYSRHSTPDQFELLPGCLLLVTQKQLGNNRDRFTATAPLEKCYFTYNGNTIQVFLGFEATPEEFLSYDKGVDPNTGKANWGAIAGPYRFRKIRGEE